MKAESPYIHLHERKRTWTPVEVSAGALLDGGEEVIQRALALVALRSLWVISLLTLWKYRSARRQKAARSCLL